MNSRDVNKKHSALLLFQDLLNDTFQEVIAIGIALARKNDIKRAVKSFAGRNNIHIEVRANLNRLKPGQVVSLSSIFSRLNGKSC